MGSAIAASPSFLEGTWVLKQAYEIKPDGSFAYPYGQNPQGILIVDAHGRYVVEIFGENRAKFPANAATLDNYKQAMTTMSVHTGQVEVAGGLLIFTSVTTDMPSATVPRKNVPTNSMGICCRTKFPPLLKAKSTSQYRCGSAQRTEELFCACSRAGCKIRVKTCHSARRLKKLG